MPGPTSGLRMVRMRSTVRCSISRTKRNWSASMPRPSPSGADRSRPFWSTMETFSAVSSGTLEATSQATADTWASLRLRPGYRLSSTEAVGAWRSRTNSDWRGMARCTRACCTVCMASIERASSPSRPRW
ncbi:Uncharacterised protein [Bordetella pertussis]|nr:Uncharacterised protein [Bordetella pertussis]